MNEIIFSPIPISELVNLITNAVVSNSKESFEKETPPPLEKEEYLTRHEVSKLFHISLVTLNKHTKSKRLQAHRIGARVLYKKSEVLSALSSIN